MAASWNAYYAIVYMTLTNEQKNYIFVTEEYAHLLLY